MDNDKTGQKDEEMTTIVSINEISEFNKTPITSDSKTQISSESFMVKECNLFSSKPCAYSGFTTIVVMIVISEILPMPSCTVLAMFVSIEVTLTLYLFTFFLVFILHIMLFLTNKLTVLDFVKFELSIAFIGIPLFFLYLYFSFTFI